MGTHVVQTNSKIISRYKVFFVTICAANLLHKGFAHKTYYQQINTLSKKSRVTDIMALILFFI